MARAKLELLAALGVLIAGAVCAGVLQARECRVTWGVPPSVECRYTISGRVLDEQGRPVAGAVIEARGKARKWEREKAGK